MKYAILNFNNEILEILDDQPLGENVENWVEISDEDAGTASTSSEPMHFAEGSLFTAEEYRIKRINEIQAEKLLPFAGNMNYAKTFHKKHISKRRRSHEFSGIVVDGTNIRTDDHTISRIYQARILAKEDPTFTTEWKMGDGTFSTLDADTIISIADAITQHLKDSFAKEKNLNDQIDAATTITDLQNITW